MPLFDFLRRRKKEVIVDSEALHKELHEKVLIDKPRIDHWIARFKGEKKSLYHPYVEIAQILTNSSLHELATDFYSRYLNEQDDKLVHSLLMQNLLLSESATNKSLLDAHSRWANLYGNIQSNSVYNTSRKRDPNKKIKIGYVCHFFTNSVSQNCLLPLLRLHDKSKFEIFCYDDGETAEEFRDCGDHWRDIRGLSDERVAEIIRSDNIDILQELNGFCFINRFGALAYRPAPIQINWYNHTSTTASPYIDYVMTDKVSIQDGDSPFYVEKAYRHDTFIAAVQYDAEKFGAVIEDPPCVKNGYVTFGYFGSSHKITLSTIGLWSRILKGMPNSRLILKCGTFSHDLYVNLFRKHFKDYGIEKGQVIFDGWSDQMTTLKKYNEIDIMLDNATVSGGSTMFEALIQSIPVVTLMGNRWATRSGASVLTTLKHPELIASSPDEYVEIVLSLAKDVGALIQYRSVLRNEMLNSSLTNIRQFYENFEAAYLYMWNELCTKTEEVINQ